MSTLASSSVSKISPLSSSSRSRALNDSMYPFSQGLPGSIFIRNGVNVAELKGYSCQLVTDEGISWLKGRDDQLKPFFLNVWFNEPHKKIASPQDLMDTYPDVDVETTRYYANVTNMDAAVGRILATLDELGLRENTFVLFMSDNGPWRDGSSGPLRAEEEFVV